MLPVATVVDGMVGGPDQPASQPVVGEAQGQNLQAQMVHHRPHRHCGEHRQQGDEMQGDQHHDPDQEQGLDKGFKGVEGEGGPGRWLTRSVVSLVKPGEEFWVVEQPVGGVEVAVLQHEHGQVAERQSPPGF